MLACSSTGEKSGHDKVEALTAAQLEVRENLKTPSTAEFPWVKAEDVVEQIDDNTFFVKGYVDSENSFGAMIRTYFTCTVDFSLENPDEYIVRDLKFYE